MKWNSALLRSALALPLLALALRADQVEMQNGDRYVGTVLSLSKETLVLQSEVLGTLRLPRNKLALISFGNAPLPANLAQAYGATNRLMTGALPALTNSLPRSANPLGQLDTNSFLARQIQSQFLSDAGPEANAKFNELLGGLATGKLNVDDLRAQAKAAADQLRAARKDLGEDSGWVIDSYLSILDHFLNEAPPPSASSANPNSALPKSVPPEQ
jgi:hypothetical protein